MLCHRLSSMMHTLPVGISTLSVKRKKNILFKWQVIKMVTFALINPLKRERKCKRIEGEKRSNIKAKNSCLAAKRDEETRVLYIKTSTRPLLS